MMQGTAVIASIFIFIALAIAGCKGSVTQKQTTELNPNAVTEQVTLKVDGMT
jgi:hypothetical protein